MTKSAKLFEKAIKLYQKGDLGGAKALCHRAQKTSTVFAQVYFLMGCIVRDEGNPGYAVTQFNKAILMEPESFHFHLNLGLAYQDLGRLEDSLDAMACAGKNVGSRLEGAMASYNIGCLLNDLGRFDEAMEALKQAAILNPQLADAHNQLATLLLNENRNEEAVLSFQKAISIDKNFLPACRNLGLAYMKMSLHKEALSAFNRFLELNGSDLSVLHLVDALSGIQTDKAPAEYIEKLFDDLAVNFEKQLVDELKYDTPARIMSLLQSLDPPIPLNHHTVLDLGCGTGLMGKALSSISCDIDGIDLSQLMLNQAGEKSTYRQLIKSDIVDFVRASQGAEMYTLLVAADVLIYIGDLAPLFSEIKKSHLFSAETVFVFSIELLNDAPYFLQTSGRYSHGESYIDELCERYNFSVIVRENTIIRKERDQDIKGLIFVVQLSA